MSDRKEQVWPAVRLLSAAVLLGVTIWLLVTLVVTTTHNGARIAALRRQVSHQSGRIEQLQTFIRHLGATPPPPPRPGGFSPGSSPPATPPPTHGPTPTRTRPPHPRTTHHSTPTHSPHPPCPPVIGCVSIPPPPLGVSSDASFPVVALGVIVGLLGMAVVLRRRETR